MLITFVIIYMVITFAVGIYTSKLVKGSKDFVQAGRRLPLFLNAADLFALWFGSETIFGASSEFAQHGLRGVVEDPFGAALCLVLFGMFFIRPVSYTHLRAHETVLDIVCRLLLEKKKNTSTLNKYVRPV